MNRRVTFTLDGMGVNYEIFATIQVNIYGIMPDSNWPTTDMFRYSIDDIAKTFAVQLLLYCHMHDEQRNRKIVAILNGQ